MSELVGHLRAAAATHTQHFGVMREAAARIEALEAALREAIAVFESWHDDETEVELLPQLRAALAPEQDQ